MWSGNCPALPSMLTGIGARSARVRIAASSPWSVRTAGWMPRASSLSSLSACWSSASVSPRSACVYGSSLDRGARGAAGAPSRRRSSRCWAPSWRSRSSRRRSSSPALTIRARDSHSSSWARSWVCRRSFSRASRGRGANRLQQPRLVEQVTVVDQHRETIAEIGDAARAIGRHGEYSRPCSSAQTPRCGSHNQGQASGRQACARAPHVPRRLNLTKLHDQIRDGPASVPHPRRPNAAPAAESAKKPNQE